MTDAVKQRLGQLRALLDILDQRREKSDGEHASDVREKIYAIELAIAHHYEAALKIEGRITSIVTDVPFNAGVRYGIIMRCRKNHERPTKRKLFAV